MLTQEKIEQFYKDIDSLGLKRPVAAISEKTGYSKGNVSSYLNKKLTPSEKFINAFYDSFKVVPKASKQINDIDLNDLLSRQMEMQIQFQAAIEVLGEKYAEMKHDINGSPISKILTELQNEIKNRYRMRFDELKEKR